MKSVPVSNIKVKKILESREKLLLPLSQEMTQYYPEELREQYRDISESIVDSGEPYLGRRVAIIDSSDVYIEDWTLALEHLLREMGRDIYIPMNLFFTEHLNKSNFDYFIYELRNALVSRGWTDLEIKNINFLIVF